MAKNEEQDKKNTTVDLRNHLFNQIERLNDPSLDLGKELEKAKALASIGNVIVNSVKIELDFMRVTGNKKGAGKKKLGNG
jgi:hypothetical protein